MAHSETIQKSIASNVEAKKIDINTGWYDRMIQESEFTRYGLYALFILIMCCTSGIAVYFMWADFSVVLLAMLALITVLPLSLMLAVAPMRIVVPAVAVSFLISVGVILAYML